MDFLLWLMGDWREMRATMDTLDREVEVEDVSMAMVRFENGAMCSVINSALCPRQETSLRLDFQKCTVEVKSLYSYTNANWCYTPVKTGVTEEDAAAWKTLPTEVSSNHASQVAALLDGMERNQRPLVSGAEARRTIEFLTARKQIIGLFFRGQHRRGRRRLLYWNTRSGWLGQNPTCLSGKHGTGAFPLLLKICLFCSL